MTGVFKTDQALRANFFQQVGQQNA
ncbi:hypothetical protein OGM84_04320 [Pediococcus acidilactici]